MRKVEKVNVVKVVTKNDMTAEKIEADKGVNPDNLLEK